MRRRELIAGAASVGVFVSGGVVAVRGLPGYGGAEDPREDSSPDDGPVEVRTVEARGSEAGSIAVPDGRRPTLLMFFTTGCGYCQAQMPRLAEARRAVDDDVRFLSVTYQSPSMMSEEELADWWARFDGDWYVGYDHRSALAGRYGIVGYPILALVDGEGELRWRTERPTVLSADEIVDAVETALPELAWDGDDSDEGGGDGDASEPEDEDASKTGDEDGSETGD